MKLKKILIVILLIFTITITTNLTYAYGRTINGSSGGRDYYLYIPDGYDQNKTYPLVVMLHGCLHSAEDFAEITNMNAIADREGFFVLYPRQKATYFTERAAGCWLWFNSSHHSRGSGEPKIIADMTTKIINNYSIDQSKVYAAGISAGASMSVILASAYPDIYSAIGVHSGLQYGAATSSLYSGYAMLTESYALSPIAQGQKAYNQMLISTPKVIPTIIFHGTADATVRSFNGVNVMHQMATTNDLADDGLYNGSISSAQYIETSLADGGRITKKYQINDTNGFEVISYYEIQGMNHAWSGGTKAYSSTSFSDPNGPNASELLWSFFTMDRTPIEEPDQPEPIDPEITSLEVDILNDSLFFDDQVNVLIAASHEQAAMIYSTDNITFYPYEHDLILEETTTLYIKATLNDIEVFKEVTFTKNRIQETQSAKATVLDHYRNGRISVYQLDYYIRIYGYRIAFTLYLHPGQTNWTLRA